MNKKNLFLNLFSLILLTACTPQIIPSTNTSSSSSISLSSSSSSSSSFSSSNISSSNTFSLNTSSSLTNSSSSNIENGLPKNKKELEKFISNISTPLSLEHEKSYSFSETIITDRSNYYGNKSVLTGNGYLLSNKHIFEESLYKKYEVDSSTNNSLGEFIDKYEYTFKTYNGLYEDKNINLLVADTSSISDTYYLDYQSGISLNTENIEETLETRIIKKSSYYLLFEFDEVDLNPSINLDGSFIYSLTKNVSGSSTDDITSYNLTLTFEKNGFLKEMSYYKKTIGYDWVANKYYDYPRDSIELKINSNYAECLYDSVENDLNPSDYVLTKTDISLINPLEYYDKDKILNPNKILVGTTIEVEAINYYPSKSLNTSLEIISSTNEEVVSNTGYAWKAIGAGKTKLKISNGFGYEKEIEVTVFSPSIESYFTTEISSIRVGDTKSFSIYTTPSDVEVTFNVTSEDESILKIEEGYSSTNFSLVALKSGLVNIHISCLENPSLDKEISIAILEELTDESISKILISSIWTGYDQLYFNSHTIAFWENGRGTIDDNIFTWSVINKRIIVGPFIIDSDNYTNNKFELSDDEKKLIVNCTDEYYSSSFSGTFYKA